MSQPETMTVIPQATSQPARRRTLRGPSQRTMLMSAAVLAASLLVATAGLATQLTDRVGGTLYGWGSNSRGQLGDGTTTNRSTPHAVPGMDDVIHVAGSYNHSLAVTSQGTVWAWGKNNHGQLGNNTFSDSLVPVQVLALTGVVQVSASDNHSMALTADGQVWTWGRGSNDALGDGSTEDRSVPATVPGLDGGVCHQRRGRRGQLLRDPGRRHTLGLGLERLRQPWHRTERFSGRAGQGGGPDRRRQCLVAMEAHHSDHRRRVRMGVGHQHWRRARHPV
jgi:hypothetical protein